MNYLTKMKKNAKALSPVVASIILIAVTVAVSIAVAAWMGGMTTGFMQTEQVQVTNVAFQSDNQILVNVTNTGTSDVLINAAVVNGETATITGNSVTVLKNSAGSVTLTLTADYAIGHSYQIKLVTSKGTNIMYNAIGA